MMTPPTVTVGIPAYNEAKNILSMVESVLRQKEAGFTVQKIIIASDGSEDDTVKIVKTITDPRVTVINGNLRRGRTNRLNQLMKLCRSDILIILDADLKINDVYLLSKLVNPIVSDSNVALVGGNPHSVGTTSFLTQSLIVTRSVYTYIRYRMNNGNNIFGCMGGILALRRQLYSTTTIPSDVVADDSFLYLTCISKGFKFVNVREAQAFHPFPSTLTQHISRNRRFSSTSTRLKKYFSYLVDREFYIPKTLYFKAVIVQTLKHPLHSLFIFLVNNYARLTSKATPTYE